MSRRLQVLMPEQEISDIQLLAKQEGLTLGEWVRRVLRDAKLDRPIADPQTKLASVRRAAMHSFPTADIHQMLAEIEQGYSS